ncbi:MAG: glycoside hydrolase family 1 protein [Candidatus Kerfeldbacteria bacterium]|nr:glycoside hydrolase family 1 protein [Candidatus Kerfeldbacteria bacterium]
MDNKAAAFPKNFFWGAATSAHQVEGHNHNDWTEWEKLGRVKNGEVSGRAAGHYERFAADFDQARELGHNAHRLSIEWSRIEPKPGLIDPDAIAHYRAVLQTLRDRGLEPFVTLHHFTNPLWIARRGGWRSHDTVDCFGRYVMAVVRELGDLVTYWITINEPTVYSTNAHLAGYWPPEQRNVAAAWSVIRNFVEAHRLAYQIIHRHVPSAKVGVASNLSNFVPVRPHHPVDRFLVKFAHYWHNQWWLDQTYVDQDFIGLNYYFHHPLKFAWSGWRNWFVPRPQGDKPLSDLGWEIHPEGLGQLLTFLGHYHRPIIVTENGVADANDTLRTDFIRRHVDQISAARERGIDIRGYFYWSLLDNFEWREGFTPRFGLIDVDYQTLRRTVRPSAYAYRDICQRNGTV